ncbi:hypothetical protein [Lactobacillus sp. UCMA15818]|uniref:hypothetical protein n=1 Tax=Lactobacillus sp. UCMA15818 TaxID=2583394 RepID=UPI0025B028CB|nr:hypothetical protein [Lactobacillus sp. UCMA15818]MDN2453414.1 hypothetical protein [Lactobacillus sp. UCMA15818]
MDLFELAILSGFWLYSNIWFLPIACSVLWPRILWQFRIHKRTDGQLLIAMIFDNPTMLDDLKNKRTAGIAIIKIIGRTVTIIIVLAWLLPLIVHIYQLIV